jgi:hypothetical protein
MIPMEPLQLALVDEGRFLSEANTELMALQRRLMAYVAEHGDAADGAKAKLTLEVTLCVENPSQGFFSIKAVAKSTVPARPASVSMAVANARLGDEPALYVRPSGSDEQTPRQTKLCTADGRAIDPATGEVMPAGG